MVASHLPSQCRFVSVSRGSAKAQPDGGVDLILSPASTGRLLRDEVSTRLPPPVVCPVNKQYQECARIAGRLINHEASFCKARNAAAGPVGPPWRQGLYIEPSRGGGVLSFDKKAQGQGLGVKGL